MNCVRKQPQPGEYSNAFQETSCTGSHTKNQCRLVSSLSMSTLFPVKSRSLLAWRSLMPRRRTSTHRRQTAWGEILAVLDASVTAADEYLDGLDDQTATANWRLTSRGKEIFTIPRAGLLRTIMLNHWYHHRGQLSVYLRLLEVPVPAIYGRSADENPFP